MLGQLFYLFNARFTRESSLRLNLLFANRVVWLAVGVLIVLQLLFVYVPFLNLWFHSAPISALDWFLPIGIGLAIFLAVEAEKALVRKLKPNRSEPRAGRAKFPEPNPQRSPMP